MIKNVIFDIGNVLLDFCWKDHIARFGFQGEKADRIAQAMMLGPIWPKLDLGLESDEDILEQFVAHTPELEQEIRLVFSDLSTIVREYEGSVDWIESLKARGYHTYYLSNYGERPLLRGPDLQIQTGSLPSWQIHRRSGSGIWVQARLQYTPSAPGRFC